MIVALDTSALSFLIEPEVPADPDEARRWQNVRDSVARFQDAGASIILPAPVIAELAAMPGAQAIAALVARRFPLFDIRPLDAKAAELAGRITQATLPKPPRTEPRQVVKFDATIIATAVRWGAGVLATTDGRDFNKFLRPLEPERIEVKLADATPRGQVTLTGL